MALNVLLKLVFSSMRLPKRKENSPPSLSESIKKAIVIRPFLLGLTLSASVCYCLGLQTQGRIQKLPETLINQIAAGEVVERPASIIKELVENSLDAGASRIDIFLTDGGIGEILIIDNGHGILKEDLQLSIERHATSKLRRQSDLENIATFGFRGEALSSIASVAFLELKSRTLGTEVGWRIEVDFGVASDEILPVGIAPGTQILVKDLFAKVPVRQKFLKSPSTELSHCTKMIKDLALGHPEVQFFWHHNGRLSGSLVASTKLGRFQECLEWEPITIADRNGELECEIFLSPPSLKQSRGEIFCYINGRLVRNRVLISAIRNAYQERLSPQHEPSAVIYLTIRYDWVDVNVHPQKMEVRVLRQEVLYPWLTALVRDAIPQQPNVQDTPPSPNFAKERAVFRRIGELSERYELYEGADALYLVQKGTDPELLAAPSDGRIPILKIDFEKIQKHFLRS